jgi:tetratricopeptide (TPR) repeat protein
MKVRYHIPLRATWQVEPPSEERMRLERAIMIAIERVVKSKAQQGAEIVASEIQGSENTSELFEHSRYRSDAGTYAIPSYQKQGVPVQVPVVSFEPEHITVTPDQVIEEKPPFQDATVLALPGNHYVKIQAHRYAATTDPIHAVTWGRLLFGTTTWTIVSRPQRSGELLYYVAGLSERLTEVDLRVQPFDPKSRPVPGATGAFLGRVLPSLPGGYTVESVYFPDGGRTAPTRQAFTGFAGQLAAARKQPRLPLDPTTVRVSVFRNIDLLLASGNSDDLEKAAELLAELDATAFSLVDADTRIRYLTALVKAWTSEPQEKAIVEIFKSVTDRKELETVIKQLKDARIWDQLFDDLDSELWSLLIALGKRFGDKSSLSFDTLMKWLLEAKLIPAVSDIRITDKGIEISLEAVAEAYEAARSFIRFIGNFFESLWMFVAHPDKLIDAVGQLAKMSLTVQLAQLGHIESIKAIQKALSAIAEQALYALKGAAVTGMGPAIERRVKWSIIWEVASWFIGVGEIKAAVQGIGFGERLAAIGRILGLLGLAEKAVEGERAAAKLETLARLFSRTSKTLAKEEDVLRLISRLPQEDVARLGRALEKLELHEATDLAKLMEANAEIGDALRKAEVLSEFSARMGGLTDDVVEAFARLSRNSHLTPDELRGLLNVIPDGVSKETMKMLADKPELLNALGKNPRAAKVLTLCKSPCFPEFATPSQLSRIERLLTDAEKRGLQVDKTRVKEYFHRPADQADLTQAIDDFEQAMRKAKPSGATPTGDEIMDEAELLQQPGIRKSSEIRLAAREGIEFDVLEGQKYPHNQVPIRDKGGKVRRLDSYDPQKQEIISRKSLATNNGQIAFTSEFEMIDHFQEFALKYPNGAVIADTAAAQKLGLANQTLTGKYILEVPVQNWVIRERVLNEAKIRGITIRDIKGKIYN